ncbi:MAG: alpha/beta hydrolase [Saprospiraceae bacterium]|nr:alpha/beta hydrolase [Saprospiraceae bacterium]
MKLKLKKRYLIPLVLVGGVFLGPQQDFEKVDGRIEPINMPLAEIQDYLSSQDDKVPDVFPENRAQVVWADSMRKTPYSIVYLHGFSASAMEGAPIHQDFAQRYGCNLLLARLADHGRNSEESFLNLSPKALVESAKEAIALGQLLGEKVILMSCSTGGTLSAYLAAENPDIVEAQIMYSPNIAIYSSASTLLTKPWGLQLARVTTGGDYRSFTVPESCDPAWTTTYRLEGLIALQALLDQTMKPEVFKKISHPVFIGCYYKNEEEQDMVVSVEAMRAFMEQISTPEEDKSFVTFPEAQTHVIAAGCQSKDLEGVRTASYEFAEQILGLSPVEVVGEAEPVEAAASE